MKVLVTGAAGFIGQALCKRLLNRGDDLIGLDNINSYYDPELKYGRLQELGITKDEIGWYKFSQSNQYANFRFIRMNLEDNQAVQMLFANHNFEVVINLGAQAGVRYSIANPQAYIESNIVGFMNILEGCRYNNVKHLVYASSSSVYGLNGKIPFSEHDSIAHPVSIYAATKKSNELMAHAYGKLYGLKTTGLRYFTVYGPWGRPDMAPMLFASAISKGKEINVFNNGDLIRDFTYVDDIVNGTIQVIDHQPEISEKGVPAKVYNIGCSHPVKLMDFISEIEKNLGIMAKKNFMPMQQGDVYQTNADTTKLEREVGYCPSVRLPEGIARFVEWYQSDKNPLKESRV